MKISDKSLNMKGVPPAYLASPIILKNSTKIGKNHREIPIFTKSQFIMFSSGLRNQRREIKVG